MKKQITPSIFIQSNFCLDILFGMLKGVVFTKGRINQRNFRPSISVVLVKKKIAVYRPAASWLNALLQFIANHIKKEEEERIISVAPRRFSSSYIIWQQLQLLS